MHATQLVLKIASPVLYESRDERSFCVRTQSSTGAFMTGRREAA